MTDFAPIVLRPAPCRAGTVSLLLPASPAVPDEILQSFPACHRAEGSPVPLPVGAFIGSTFKPHSPAFQVVGRAFLPGITLACPLLRALTDWNAPSEALSLTVSCAGFALACITLSDKGYAGKREDTSGPAMADMVRSILPLRHSQRFILPDDPSALRALVLELAAGQGYDLILTSGGTGLSPRDTTPEALLPLLSRRLPGFEQAMMQVSLAKTPHAALSRAIAGCIGPCLLLALPGSHKAATENLAAVLPAILHALAKLQGDPTDCGG